MAVETPQFRPIDILSLREHIEQQVREAILNGTFKPGERLIEVAIAEQLGVSRAPVREALSALEREGIVVSVPRRGYSVVDLSEKDIEEIYSLRLILEIGALHRAAGRFTRQDFEALQQSVDALGEAIQEKRPYQERAAMDLQFHELICRAADHLRLFWAWNSMRMQTWLLIGLTSRSHHDRPARQQESHQAMLDHLVEGDLARVEVLLKEHFAEAQQRAWKALQEMRATQDESL
jgi:DNA-binding GntR family transcriptional regulator